MKTELPQHLRKYVVEQDDEKYTPVDHAVWRFILRQLRAFLSKHAHESYLEGLEKTGIEVERIPRIDHISDRISRFGWRAIPVSGFIPPAAFMELQALSILPIASDIRSLEHLLYTPAPDIVHEAAGHAPLLAHPEFAEYLKRYAKVARKALISKEDMDLYEAIRILSDIKENPTSTSAEIKAAEDRLSEVSAGMSHVSEATWLSRMNWWTAEYGLIGDPASPRIYGAGLLSSVGESRLCLSSKVRKIPMSIECIDFSYDITEQQPQLFVTPDFATLNRVLDELADRMAFKIGGLTAVRRAIEAKTVNTVELNSGLQISGVCVDVRTDREDRIAFLRFDGPTQLAMGECEFPGHNKEYHAHGFSSPLGFLKSHPGRCPSTLTDSEWTDLGALPGGKVRLEYENGIVVVGDFAGRLETLRYTVILTLENAKAEWNGQILFDPSWGRFDIAIGSTVPSVFGGPADRAAYGDTDDFVAARVHRPRYSEKELRRQKHYAEVRTSREEGRQGNALIATLKPLIETHLAEFNDDWLLVLEAYELAVNRGEDPAFAHALRERLDLLMKNSPDQAETIRDGLTLAADLG